ncbi:tetratricopeptide repeat protein [Bernardetia sp. OM2101]|uniref:tetratricopeptide repeat protein n=1 Tax=Bernardetia sp. OM2101 TaxID=3344876 RepID=UPI0035D0FD0A
MKKAHILTAIFLFLTTLVFAQTTEKEDENQELYPITYSFEKANEFLEKGETDKAIWFYINLYPKNKKKVVEFLKAFQEKNDSLDMNLLVKKSFTIYAMGDPSIMSFEDGKMNLNTDNLNTKGSWGDELIIKLSSSDEVLSSAADYNARALEKIKKRDLEGGIDDFSKALEIESVPLIYFNRGFARSLLGNFEGAIEDYNKTIELDYNLAQSYYERGYCHEQMNELKKALTDYTKAIEENKDYVEAYNNRAIVKLKQHKTKEGIKDLDMVIKIDANFVNAYVSRGFAKQTLNDKKGACKDWKKAVELGFEQANEFIEENCK